MSGYRLTKDYMIFKLFKSYYRSSFDKAGLQLDSVKFRHFRFELFSRRALFERVRDVFNDEIEVKKRICRMVPKNAYFTPVKWLSPIYVAKTKTETDVMLSSPLFFDIDLDVATAENFRAAKNTLISLIDFISKQFSRRPDLVVFSGRKGFHLYYWDWDFDKMVTLTPIQRIKWFIQERKRFLKDLKAEGISVDPTVTADPYRLMKVPNTLHGKTGLIARPVKEISSFNPITHCIAFEEEKYKELFDLNLEFYEC